MILYCHGCCVSIFDSACGRGKTFDARLRGDFAVCWALSLLRRNFAHVGNKGFPDLGRRQRQHPLNFDLSDCRRLNARWTGGTTIKGEVILTPSHLWGRQIGRFAGGVFQIDAYRFIFRRSLPRRVRSGAMAALGIS
ncbi:hypothetical protein KCP70_17010 [Salmonella enterica subsp. enterica]|nr:hypothetical protein KCP70_17010 [Salmonella enterica subsp. enterica]